MCVYQSRRRLFFRGAARQQYPLFTKSSRNSNFDQDKNRHFFHFDLCLCADWLEFLKEILETFYSARHFNKDHF